MYMQNKILLLRPNIKSTYLPVGYSVIFVTAVKKQIIQNILQVICLSSYTYIQIQINKKNER